MENLRLEDLIELIKGVAEQDASANISIASADTDSSFEDLGLDSLSLLSVVAQLEKQYDIRLPLEETAAMKTIGGMYSLIERRYAGCARISELSGAA
jgi:acyl carrier protein